MLKVTVYDRDTIHDDALGERCLNLNLQNLPENGDSNGPVPFDVLHQGKKTGVVYLMFSRKDPFVPWRPPGAFNGMLHVTVNSIQECGTAGLFEKTDPYVSLQLGKESLRTESRKHSGGTTTFDETLTFMNKDWSHNLLSIGVFSKNMLTHTQLGQLQVDLNLQNLGPDGASEHPVPFELMRKEIPSVKVYLTFSRSVPKGAYAGTLHCTVHKIDEFADTAGFMDR